MPVDQVFHMIERDRTLFDFSAIPDGIRERIPDGWQPSPMPEDCQLSPTTFVVAEAYMRFIAPVLRGYFIKRYGAEYGSHIPDELTHDLALTVMDKFTEGELPGGMYPNYFKTIGDNRMTDYLRAQSNLPQNKFATRQQEEDAPDQLEQALNVANVTEPGPEEIVCNRIEGAAMKTRIDELVGQLTPTQADFMRLYLSDPDMSYEEMGKILDVRPGTLRVTKLRALARMKALATDAGLARSTRGAAADWVDSPVKTLGVLRGHATKAIREARGPGANAQTISMPLHIGPWRIAASAIQGFIQDAGSEEQSPGACVVAYPYREYLPQLAAYLAKPTRLTFGPAEAIAVGSESPDVILDTPQRIAQIPEVSKLPIDLILAPERSMDQLPPELCRQAGFLLHIAPGIRFRPGEEAYGMQSYEEQGGKRLLWRGPESVRFIREWMFQTGKEPTEGEIMQLHEAGQGPPLRRLCRDYGDLATLLDQARRISG